MREFPIMASIKIPHLVEKAGAAGALPRWYWEPSPALRRRGWHTRRVPSDWHLYQVAASLQLAAASAAEAMNRAVVEAAPPRHGNQPIVPQRTLDQLIELYRGSDDFLRLRASTQRGYRQCCDQLSAWGGEASVAAIGWPQIEALKKHMARRPSFLNAVIRVLRILLGRAVKLGWLERNPAERPGLRGTEPSGLIWPPEAVTAFVAAADRMDRHSIGTAVLLNEWIGQRQGDILRLPRSIWRAGTLNIRQSKTGAAVSLPIDLVPHLMRRLQAEIVSSDLRHAVKPAQLIVDESTGRAYQPDRFRHLFAEIRAVAANDHPSFEVDYLLPGRQMTDPEAFTVKMTDLWFMHLRHTAVTRLAEAECEIPLIAAVTAHTPASVNQIINRYLRRTRQLARLAFQKRLAATGNASAAEKKEDKA